MPPPPPARWMTLGEASAYLGVDASTLRGWADAGRIRAFRTPGGHRRFAREDLLAFIAAGRQRVERPVDELLGPHGTRLVKGRARRRLHAQPWYRALDRKTAESMRHTCRRLMESLAGYLAGGRRQGDFLRRGEDAGRALGARVAALGLSTAAAIGAFLFFREVLTDAVAGRLPLSPDRKVRSMRRIETFLNRVMLSMVEAYQGRQPRARSTGGGG